MLCGPGSDDDDAPTATQPCYPGNLDEYRQDFDDLAEAIVPVLKLASDKGVILVKSAGNDNNVFCIGPSGRWNLSCNPATDQMLDMSVDKLNAFAAARRLPSAPTTSPLLVVEAHDASRAPASFSQPGGDIAAPGVDIASTVPDNGYETMSGTSMAAPFVTGAIGFLYTVKPNTTWQTMLAAIKDGARTAPGGATRQLDVFGAEVRLNLLKSAIDVNDWSADGNRRVFYGDDQTAIAVDTVGTNTTDAWDAQLGRRTSSPDGRIDMRDFRKFRDAWLMSCAEGSAGVPSGSAPACPTAVSLDGDARHPKKDLNGDRCVRVDIADCEARETWYSRFDANGDGVLSMYRQAPVGITATGAPATTTTPMTDFDVFKAFFDSSTSNTEGWTRNDLATLLVSSDIELGLADFWAAGATSVAVSTFVDGVQTGPARTFAKPTTGPGGGIITVPVKPQGSKVELVASANGPDGKPLTATPFVVESMVAGADRRATPCVARLELSFDSPALLSGTETGVTAQVVDCNPATGRPEVNDLPVTFGVQATGSDVPVITTANPRPMDAKGQATATLRAGVGTGTFTVWAEVGLPGGKVLRGEADVTVTEEITVSYVWQSVLADYLEEGTSRWSGQPDCAATGISYCIDHATSRIEPEFPGDPGYVIERRGTITATADGIELTERANGGSGILHADVTWTELATGEQHDNGVKRYYFELDPADRNRYVNHPVPVDIMPVADEVWVSNLRSIATLGYRSVLSTAGNASAAREINVPHEFFLKPRSDGSSIAFADDVDTVLRFDRTNPNAAGYQWCGAYERDLTEPPGYYTGEWDPWVIGALEVERDTQYDPGDVPLMATTGEIRFDVSFAATMAIGGDTPPEPQLPACGGTNPPNAEYRVVNPAPIEEGEAVQFVDRSTDPDGDIASRAWDFGGTGSSTVRDPNFGQGFPDEGTYPVTLTVTDEEGNSDSFTQNVTVVNSVPTIEAVSPIVLTSAGTPVSVSVLVDDAGKEDRRSLKVTLASSNTKFGGNRVVNKPAGAVRFDLGGLPAGDYPITATVTDDAGQSATTTFTLYASVVAPEPIPAPPVPPVLVEARGCTTPIPLDLDEAELLARINAQRAAAHQPPLVMSSKLTAAAERHSSDLLATGDVSDTGSDGSSSRDRITDAGYPRTAGYGTWNSGSPTIGEAWANLRQYSEIGTWFGPGMSMIGISRVSDDISTRWVVHVGGVMDCDETTLPVGSAPVASLSAPASIEEGVTVTVDPTSTDPDGDLSRQTVYWGDGTYGGIRHRYSDDGTYTITVVAEDRRGNMSHATTQIVVTKAAPEVAITPGRLVVGERGDVVFTVLDIAAADRPLSVEITTDPPHFAPAPSTYTMSSGVGGFALRPTAAGSFTVTVAVTDPDGMTGTATQTFEIDAQAGDPPTAPANVVLPPAPTCAAGMEVIGQAAEQLAILNAYRARHGLGALVVVPQLTVAAERHAADMAAHRFFAHEGSDGSTPGSRIREAGYLGGGGENIALRAVTPAEHLAGWIMSPPHHANILNPTWKAIGIADVNGPDGVLGVHVFGDRITCPTGDETPPEPRVLANPVAGKPTGTLGTAATDSGPIAPATAELATVAEVAPGTEQSSAAAAVDAEPPAVTSLAVVISDRTPEVGQRLTVVNRSRDHGFPKSIVVGTPLTPMDTLAPDATRRFTLLDPGSFTIQLSANGYPNVPLTMSLTLAVTGDALAPVVQVFGVPGAVSGELVTLRAKVSEANGTPAPGRPVRFSIGAITTVATSDEEGMVSAEMRAELAAGEWPLRAEVLTDSGEVAAMDEITITLGANIAPIAEAGDAYFVNIGDDVTLDGSGSYDPDGDQLTYTWDVNSDGQFDDATTATPTIAAIDVPTLLCGGVCESDVEYPIALRVTDAKGGGSEDLGTVTFTRDFAVVIAPEIITITPGSSNSFLVDVVTTSGFTGSVTLSAAGLPAGANVVFTPAAITPGQQSTMTVTLPSDVGGVETIDLAVTGTSGSLARTANSIVDVVFGLPPRCTTVVEGTVLDAETGDPVAGALVGVTDANPRRNVYTDAQGKWRLEGVSPSTTNQPGPVSRRVEAQGYWSQDLKSTATCDVPLQLVDRIVPVHHVTLRGQVRVGAENPTNPAQLVPTDAVAPNTRVTVSSGNTTYLNNVPVDSDGAFEVVVPLGNGNANLAYAVRGNAPEYWPGNATPTVSDGSDAFVMVLLRGKCTARVTGGRVVDAANVPVPGASVRIGDKTAVAGPDGWYTIDVDVPMATGNIGGSASVTAGPPSSRSDLVTSSKSVSINSCGDVLRVDMVLPFKPEVPPVVNVYGKISGVITDVDTGLPVAGAEVKAGDDKATTASDGSYLIDEVRIGTGTVTQANVGVTITRSGYWQESGSVLVRKDETSTYDKAILPIHKGTVSGVVRDQVTGAPLAGAKVLAGSVLVYSDDAGLFTATGVSLGNRNSPTTITVSAELAGYWKRNVQVQVRDGETVSAELALLRECATAEIRGIVVNAETRQPIAGAEVKPTEMSKVTTGADGRFTITGIKMKSGNTPWEVTLVASAAGFVSQTKKVNVFCGARIDVGFGSLPANPGVIAGTVVDAATGAPLGNMFVGTGFGGSTTTSAADGSFRIENVPTNDDGTAVEWEVSVVPDALDPHLPAAQVVSVLPGATVTVDFALELPAPPNQAPTAALAAPAGVAEGGDVSLDASASSDPEGGAMAFDWDLDGDGAFDDANGPTTSLHLSVAGTRVVSVRVTDDAGATAVASAVVVAANVEPVVDAGESVTLGADGHLSRTGSFVDPGADTFTATVDYGEGSGSVPLALDGKSFVLDHTYPAGSYTVTVWVYDTHGGAGQHVFGVTVPEMPPPNAAPVANPASVTTLRDTAVAVGLTGSDADGDTLVFDMLDAPAHGVLTGTAPELTYLPGEGYVGADSFTFRVGDGEAWSPPATVSITVEAPPPPPNTAPVANPASVTTLRDTAVAVLLSGSDADGDAFTFEVLDAPAHGVLTGTAPDLTYTPEGGYTGADSFTFRVGDGMAWSQPATVSITVEAPPVASAQLLLSDDVARSRNVRPLDGQTLRDGAAMYVFVGPDAIVPSIKRVKFYLDDPQRTNAPFSTESELSWDFARTAPNRNGCRTCADSPAYPFESNLLSLGTHSITAVVEFKDGRTPVVLTSTFTVADTTPHQLLVSSRSDRGSAEPLAGATLKGKRYVFLGPAADAIAGADRVRFVLDGKFVVDEALTPYDLKATAADGSANALDTRTLTVGYHTLQAIVMMPEGVSYTYKATFKVAR